MSMHIVLVGFMGAGKTTVGRMLASLLQRPFIDVDHLIQSNASRTIADIFAQEGEAGFRALEAAAVQQAVAREAAVIAVGGGALQHPANARTLRRHGELVWLRAPLDEMLARAIRQGGRPMLGDPAAAAELYNSRVPVYDLADVVVDVGGLSPEEAVRAVHRRLVARGQIGGPGVVPTESGAAADARTVVVDFDDRSYEVRVGSGLLARSGVLCDEIGLSDAGLLVTNEPVGNAYAGTVLRALSMSGRRVPRLDIPDGEEYKTVASAVRIYDAALTYRLDRRAVFYALGGGVVGDVTGFAAATYMRGVDLVAVPTTLLAQVDSSVGGKTGVNLPQGKNLVGAFHQPRLVVADVDTLATLPGRQLAAGMAEVIKYGAIQDAPLFDYLEGRVDRLTAMDKSSLISVVARSCRIKADVVRQDERETAGVRELLNFGHTVGHALETLGGYSRWLHGEAVAIGMVTAALLSRRAGGLSDDDVARLVDLVKAYQLPVSPGPVDRDALRSVLLRDKKVRHGRPRFVLLRSIGSAYVTDEVKEEWIWEALQEQQTL